MFLLATMQGILIKTFDKKKSSPFCRKKEEYPRNQLGLESRADEPAIEAIRLLSIQYWCKENIV